MRVKSRWLVARYQIHISWVYANLACVYVMPLLDYCTCSLDRTHKWTDFFVIDITNLTRQLTSFQKVQMSTGSHITRTHVYKVIISFAHFKIK